MIFNLHPRKKDDLIARFVRISLPDGISEEKAVQIIPGLDDDFVELSGVVNRYLEDYEKKYKPVVLEKNREVDVCIYRLLGCFTPCEYNYKNHCNRGIIKYIIKVGIWMIKMHKR